MAVQRILLAHQNADCRRIFGSALAYEGYAVAEVTDGDIAMGMLRRTPFDLVITDLYLRSATDECLVRRVRADGILKTLPVIVLTAWSTEPHRKRALDEGADAYFLLPVGPRELLAVVHDLLAPKVPPQNGYRTLITPAALREERASL